MYNVLRNKQQQLWAQNDLSVCLRSLLQSRKNDAKTKKKRERERFLTDMRYVKEFYGNNERRARWIYAEERCKWNSKGRGPRPRLGFVFSI